METNAAYISKEGMLQVRDQEALMLKFMRGGPLLAGGRHCCVLKFMWGHPLLTGGNHCCVLCKP